MREFQLNIDEAMQRGLRPLQHYGNRAGFLEDCYQMRPSDFGLRAVDASSDPFAGAVSVGFPLPQIADLSEITLLLGTTSVREVDRSVSPWTLTTITTHDPDAPASSKAILSGGVWHVADFGDSWYLSNGSSVVFRTGIDSLIGDAATTFVEDAVSVQTLCAHRGRIVLGGLDSSNLFNQTWQDIFTEWQASMPESDLAFSWEDIGSNWVMWSSIGGGDLPLWLFMPTGYSQLGFDLTGKVLLDRIKRNEMGWMRMPWQGMVYVVKSLGDNVIVYGSGGVVALVRAGNTFGMRVLVGTSVTDRGAVGGNEQVHLFVDDYGSAWLVRQDLSVTRLGFQEYLGVLSGGLTVSFDEEWQDFYICDGDEGYLLNDGKLSEHRDRLTSLARINGTLYGLSASQGTTQITVQTAPFDMDRRGMKTIENVQVYFQDLTSPTVTLYYRYGSSAVWSSIGPRALNTQGVVWMRVTADEFRVRVQGTPGTTPRVEKIETRWNFTDKRAVRGVF